jgi:hypothetical protein
LQEFLQLPIVQLLPLLVLVLAHQLSFKLGVLVVVVAHPAAAAVADMPLQSMKFNRV